MKIPKSKWKWFGCHGHFICGRWCRFHLCTQVGKYLVSTVGEYIHPRHSGGSENAESKWLDANWPGSDLAPGRKFETMVFLAGKPCTEVDCDCGQPETIGDPLDFGQYNVRGDAARGHMMLCEKWAKK